MLVEKCPQFDTLCRFASIETAHCAFTAIKLQDHHYVPVRQGYKKNVLGVRCNNDGRKMCDELKQCPARRALSSHWTGIRAEGSGIYAKLVGTLELQEIMRVKTLGQQTLGEV